MTAPNPAADPTAPPAAPPAPAPPAPPAAPPAPPAPPAFDPSTLPPEAQAYIKKQAADAEAAARVKARDEAKASAADEATKALTAKLAAALGLAPDPAAPADPAKLQADLEALRDTSRADKVTIALYSVAGTTGANAAKLADSLSFMNSIKALNPADSDFAVKLTAAVTAATTADPSLKSGPPVAAPPAAGEFGQGPGAPAGATGGDAAIDEMAKTLGYGDPTKKR